MMENFLTVFCNKAKH